MKKSRLSKYIARPLVIVLMVVVFVWMLSLTLTAWSTLWGSRPLGNQLFLWDGDGDRDRIIILCDAEPGGTCVSGIYVVPERARHMVNNRYSEYVKEAESNAKWVIAKTTYVNEKKESFYIIDKSFHVNIDDCKRMNCDNILQGYVIGPLDAEQFRSKKDSLGVDLNFE